MSSLSSVFALKPFKSMWKIKVKIIRLWKQYSAAAGLTIEMVFIDSEGDKIHASVKKELVNQFDQFLIEGDSRIFINFAVSHATGSYRTTHHAYKIGFLSTTRVRQCEALPAELNGFEPTNYQDLLEGNLNPDFLIDLIGQIVEVSHVESVSVNGKEMQKISLELRDAEDARLPLVLWGVFATDVNNAVQVRSEQSLTVVLRFGKIKVWKEKSSVSNAYNVSTVSINPEMLEVETFVNT
uniref:Replication protein A 70 kDa DNA-binding subunit C n=1 Tax=Noccaea caerulescens TaxID=107243 RepID=A0A1J3CYL5_NOCCA